MSVEQVAEILDNRVSKIEYYYGSTITAKHKLTVDELDFIMMLILTS